MVKGEVYGNLYFDNDNEDGKYYIFTSESDKELLQDYVNKHLTIETEYKSNYYIDIFGEKGTSLFNVNIIEISEPTRPILIIREPYRDPNIWVDYPQSRHL